MSYYDPNAHMDNQQQGRGGFQDGGFNNQHQQNYNIPMMDNSLNGAARPARRGSPTKMGAPPVPQMGAQMPSHTSRQSNELQFEDFGNHFSTQQPPNFGAPSPQAGQMGMAGGQYGGEIYSGSMSAPTAPEEVQGTFGYDNEPPLLEELEINFDQIKHKAAMALNPIRPGESNLMDDTDLAGPLLFCLMFGGSLLLSGKIHFGIIYGAALIGCIALFALLNLMSDSKQVSLGLVCSVLGYCLLPMVLLSLISAVLDLQGVVGLGLVATAVMWCTVSAAKMFVFALTMTDQRLLVGYPCMLIYGIFALMTVY